jgi:hypothetical protein
MDFNSYERLITHSDYTELSRPFLETENFIYYSITDRAKPKQRDQYYRRNKPYWFNKEKGTSFELGQSVEGQDVYHFFGMPMSIYGNRYAELIPNMAIEIMRSAIKKRSDLFKNRELRDMIMDENPDLEAILVLYEFKDSW